ncbi:hypothetical protein HPP92_011727 [Vanilla planifolia]|uniref:Cytochrome c oxidase subunit 5C n=1 Tax=Vanilla planifolia TaxID=51239 RepID=A0A835R2E2_VANPL|nr:hypothetical protein HPP92_011727 [Vanilla planifolia]
MSHRGLTHVSSRLTYVLGSTRVVVGQHGSSWVDAIVRVDAVCYVSAYVDIGKQKDSMAAHRVAHATLKGPSVVKEICIGITLGLIAGGLWKMHHWNEQRKTRAFYDMLEKGEISVVVPEE